MRFFNTAGPVGAEDHYAIPPLKRGNVAEILQLIRDRQYFVLHAPRQTGKTSALIALRDLLNGGGAPEGARASSSGFRCVDVNVEVGQVARDDTERGIRAILGSLADSAMLLGDDFPAGVWLEVLEATVERGVEQTLGYMGRCGAEEGHLVVFDRRKARGSEREERIAPKMEAA